MKRIVTTGIVLRRVDYGEADRIVSLLTHNEGKITVFAKGVRKPSSRLAGGIELFSVNDITYIPGKSDMTTLVSSRVLQYFGTITHDYERTMYGYKLLKVVDALTENTVGEPFFIFLREALAALDSKALSLDKIQLWASLRLLALLGNIPNLLTDDRGDQLSAEVAYNFDVEHMCFTSHPDGLFNAHHIKIMRFCTSAESALLLLRLQADEALFQPARVLMQQIAGETLQAEL